MAPQLLAVDRPYVRQNMPGDNRVVTVTGFGFGFGVGAGAVVLELNTTAVTPSSWSDTKIVFTVPAGTALGATPISITRADGLSSVNGLTIQVLNSSYDEGGGGIMISPAEQGESNDRQADCTVMSESIEPKDSEGAAWMTKVS